MQRATSVADVHAAAGQLRDAEKRPGPAPEALFEVLEAWSAAIAASPARDVPGVPFLKLWLRRATFEGMLCRELGPEFLRGDWTGERARLKDFPVGIVGHWPAANIEIQPLLSMVCAQLGGNVSLVRVPSDLVNATERLAQALAASDESGVLRDRVRFVSFPSERQDLHVAMAERVDGAMIWGGRESVMNVRSLPFPPWARIASFGPRISVAMLDSASWSDPEERATWCQRLARDTWQFEQQACSSPQALFIEKSRDCDPAALVEALSGAFREENRLHPRQAIAPSLASAIVRARASWLLDDVAHSAQFDPDPDWTILFGRSTEVPEPTQGRTLPVLEVDDLLEPLARFDGQVQTLGLGMVDRGLEERIAEEAGRRGVDRIVKLGRMHVFESPWDGQQLVAPMTRRVRHQVVAGGDSAEESIDG